MFFDNDAILKANRLTCKFRTTDPFKISEEIGVRIFYMDLKNIKGMYAYVLRNRYIVLDNKLGEVEQRIVLAHEIGHDQLDRGSCFRTFTDRNSISYETHRSEIGANYFSAQLLIPDEDFFEMLESKYDYFQMAAELRVFPELMMLKVDMLNMQGHDLAPFDLGSKNFLKKRLDM
ncbi:MAG: ImmA/IrrE family metallo-endopeptidase [Eubacteriales bacterium]|nr:ImmA/IrrE family metallo-endopeptidase [Eubacteriales bacterium]MDD4475506.1 ImmA/IrrE family metallo-endopeptidase [Eubacteriales bacterium]